MALKPPYSKVAPAGGGYRLAMYTGSVVAGLAAAAPIFSCRWTSTSTRMIVQSIMLDFYVVTAYGTAQGIGNSLYFARNWTISDSGGTAIVTTQTKDQALDTTMPQSQIWAGSGDIRIATTAALTAGTRTLDDQALYSWLGSASAIGAASNNPDLVLGWMDATNPLTFRQNEGFVITNDILLGATGVIVWNIGFEWTEVSTNYT